MLRDLLPKAYRRYLSLPVLGPVVEAYERWAHEQGYPPGSRRDQLHALIRIDRYLRRHGGTATWQALERCRRWYRHRQPMAAGTSRLLVRFLVARGDVIPPSPSPLTQTQACVAAYAAHLAELRGLAASTIHQHAWTATQFLTQLGYERDPSRLACLAPGDLDAFLTWAGRRLCRATLQHTVAALRSFLRFLAAQGAVPAGLDTQVDTPRCYRQEQLPRALPWEMVRAFLAAIDQRTPLGRRDYVMFLLIATYGLRACEVVALTLDAIDWRAGVLHVPGRKYGAPRALPLTTAAATVLCRYLRDGRPASTHRELFLRGRAPAGPLKPTALPEAFQAWVRRSGLPIRFQGPHCLRHTVAVHLLRQGVPLKALGDLLGHRSAESTEAYLRLAVEDLRTVPLPVPEGQP